MTPSPERSVRVEEERAGILRQIPSVDQLLNRPAIAELCQRAGREFTVEVTRRVLADLRERADVEVASLSVNIADIEMQIIKRIEEELAPSLRSVINATGVVLHTNLGRAPIGKLAAEHLTATSTHYSNLEYDLAEGARGKRDSHTNKLLAELVGAESAIVVNNNAAAVFLVLNTLAKGAEVIVSRGELIEIGDGFRIPDIMAQSGAELREVGTTNRTRIADYERAVTERTRLLLRVHPSNFRIVGFTKRPELKELVGIGKRLGIPVVEDLGSGCLVDLSSLGIDEPVVRASFDAGVDVVTFSGDKLLGGPQAGIIAGKKNVVERIRRNPLFRALRVDKLTIAVLEMTLRAYRRGAWEEIPALRMIRMTAHEIEQRARAFVARLTDALPKDATLEIRDGSSVIGGGSTPDQKLPTSLLAIASRRYSAVAIEERLRRPASGTPVIARIEEDRLVIDLRTVFVEEEEPLAQAVIAVLR
ncbi:MAG TPA: L-seryl-tRNA(Sec) selenium transferase [Candidatus Acidoferrales bacterium]|nr:L-seryl-tRNA(Sec) selenium transferase [Candidatus Acidoferrales bacterium]